MKNYLVYMLFLYLACSCSQQEKITIILPENPHSRVQFGIDKLTAALEDEAYGVQRISASEWDGEGRTLLIGQWDDPGLTASAEQSGLSQIQPEDTGDEGFQIISNGKSMMIRAAGPSGVLYGIMEIKDRFMESGMLDFSLNLTDQPEMVLRGACIGMQKTTYLPGRSVYEYPYTPENFPWFYDKELWIDYLDMLVENRMNSLYLWNGHPFASLVKLEDYPYALEVDEKTFQLNEEMFQFITSEADKRGIWIIQMFYNIIVSKPFAEEHHIKTQDRSRPIMPLIADYTRKSIAAFIEKYPNVGLLVALGEAMQGEENDIEWFTKTVLPGVQDGMKTLGMHEEPPIILRAHDTNAPLVMQHALPIYKNLYTMHKYNGESLTTYQPRGPWSQIHRDLSSSGSIHISNVHILANLEPFRYGSPDFIQKSVQAMHQVHGANALHLYPQASYWDWPYTADKAEDRLLQIDRDWIWYKAWGRYAWKADRERETEIDYWTDELGDLYGSKEAGRYILEAYEETGEIAPKLLRRFGITEGNRQTLLLGMFASQLVNPYKWRVYPGFYESCGPEGEILLEYADKAWSGETHVGETPPQIIREVVHHGNQAWEAIEKAAPHVSAHQEEFDRLRNDIHAYKAFADFFADKVEASMLVLRYGYSGDLEDLENALPYLEKSVDHYRKLVNLTKDAYLYANSMQTAQRRIPIGGDEGKHKTWEEMLPHYERELDSFRRNLSLLKSSQDGAIRRQIAAWKPADIAWTGLKEREISTGSNVFNDKPSTMINIADELKELKGIQFSADAQQAHGTVLKFRAQSPVKLVVGYFNTDQKGYLKPPTLETNAAGNERGEAEVLLANALEIAGHPRINIHTFDFGAGDQELRLDKGMVLILGAIDGETALQSRDVGIIGESEKEAIDWLFY